MSHLLNVFERFHKVTERSRMAVTTQHCLVLHTFNQQSIKIIQANILCASNFRMHMFSNFNVTIKTFLPLAKPLRYYRFPFIHPFLTHSCL